MPAKQGAAPVGTGPGPAGETNEDGTGSDDGTGSEDPIRREDRSARSRVLRGDSADNTVMLRGRVSSTPVERELPSGALIVTFRISVARARTPMTTGSRQAGDWVDCSAWTARTRRVVGGWAEGDYVEVSGALRRRFFRVGSGPSTRVEVEVLGARRARPRCRSE
jgi:single-strand DNA-binding protein